MAQPRLSRTDLQQLYRKYNQVSYLFSDPVLLVHEYSSPADREVAGLLAATLAYGRVGQILKHVESLLSVMGSPAAFARETSLHDATRAFRGFRHRFTSGEEVAVLVYGAGRLIGAHGSLGALFKSLSNRRDETVLPALTAFAHALRGFGACDSLVSDPAKGSACKRLNLYLRWMIRRDAVDPGGWTGVSRSKLIVPLDTHMHRVGLSQGWTSRRAADMRTALEITAALRAMAPRDPIRYDFALTRSGILANRRRGGGPVWHGLRKEST